MPPNAQPTNNQLSAIANKAATLAATATPAATSASCSRATVLPISYSQVARTWWTSSPLLSATGATMGCSASKYHRSFLKWAEVWWDQPDLRQLAGTCNHARIATLSLRQHFLHSLRALRPPSVSSWPKQPAKHTLSKLKLNLALLPLILPLHQILSILRHVLPDGPGLRITTDHSDFVLLKTQRGCVTKGNYSPWFQDRCRFLPV